MLSIATKMDGAPAVICWSKIEGYPDNSICLKSFVNGPKNALSSKEQIMERYGDRPGMYKKLMYCLQIAKSIPKGEAWQGDCLFTRDELGDETIDGVDSITFQPNTILYAVPKDSATAQKMLASKFGIVFHTVYKGTAGNFTQTFDPAIDQLKVPSYIYILNNVMDKEDMSNDQLKEVVAQIYDKKFKPMADKLKSEPDYDEICSNELFMEFWNTYENSALSDRQKSHIDEDNFVEDFEDYITVRNNKLRDQAVAKVKSDAAKARNADKFNSQLAAVKEILNKHVGVLTTMVKLLNIAVDIKYAIMDSYAKTRGLGMNTYVRSRSRGLVKTKPEGYAMSNGPDIVKLVDRTDFSSNNRSDDIIKGFEHD